MVISHGQQVGKNHNIMTGNKFFKKVEQFSYLGTTLTIQTSIHEELSAALRRVRNELCGPRVG